MKFFQNSQREWERSTDLMNPNHALYQLSYRLKLAYLCGQSFYRLELRPNVVETKGIEPFTA